MEILYGRNPVYESLCAGRRVPNRLLVADGASMKGRLAEAVELARRQTVPVTRVPKSELSHRLGHPRHQGVVLETSTYPHVHLTDILGQATGAGAPLVLFLDLLQDPQNVGTLLRTAEVVGVNGVVLQERRSAGITPAVVSASSGATEHLRIAKVVNLVQAMRELKDAGLWLYGLSGDKDVPLYHQSKLDGPLGLVVGSEDTGLRRLVRDTCDGLIRLPMRGRIESLNAAVAGSVVLYLAQESRGDTRQNSR